MEIEGTDEKQREGWEETDEMEQTKDAENMDDKTNLHGETNEHDDYNDDNQVRPPTRPRLVPQSASRQRLAPEGRTRHGE